MPVRNTGRPKAQFGAANYCISLTGKHFALAHVLNCFPNHCLIGQLARMTPCFFLQRCVQLLAQQRLRIHSWMAVLVDVIPLPFAAELESLR